MPSGPLLFTSACGLEEQPPSAAQSEAGVVALDRPPETPAPPAPQSESAAALVTVHRIIDGDTIDTSEGRVRFIGIDTPELSTACGPPAKAHLDSLIGGQVELRASATTDDRDRYERLLRYVITPDGTDVGYQMIRDGWAIARYDSRDGYDFHANEAAYHAASPSVVTGAGSAPAPQPAPAPSGNPYGLPSGPPPGPDLDCVHVGQPVWVGGSDPHRLDSDGDGIGCDSY